MTTETVQHEEIARREPLPPVEQDSAAHALVEEHVAMEPTPAVMHSVVPAHTKTQEAAPATGIAGWLSRNRWFTKEPITNIGYQFVRATFATIPYGFGMAFGHHGFQIMGAKGQKMGLTEEGMKRFAEKGALAMSAVAKEERALLYKEGASGVLGRNMMRIANSPMNAAVQIGLGFTMFRFVGGVVKNLRDRVMNEHNTPEQTVAEVKHAGKTIWETMKINAPAEATGTPIAALVLGFMGAAYTPVSNMPKLLTRDKAAYPGIKGFAQQVGKLWSKESKLLQNAGVWTFSYSLFFLMAESLFKDKQIQRGKWKGHPNSLKNGPDDTVGGPGAVSYTPPESKKKNEVVAQSVNAVLNGSAEEGYKQYKDNDIAQDSQEQLRYPLLTGEPSMGRFLIRRVAPVAVGISAYAALKRVGYLAEVPFLKGLSGPMEPITVKKLEEMKTVGDHAKVFVKNAYKEGKATIMFGALWAATDAWGGFYDKWVHKLQKPENAVPLDDHQQANHANLLVRLNEKDKVAGRAA